MVACGKALRAIEQPEAEKRMKAGKRPSGKFPQGAKGEVADKVGKVFGVSGKTYRKAEAVRRCGELLQQIEAKYTGRIKGGMPPNSDTRKAAHREAGLSTDQAKAAIRVANIDGESFDKVEIGNQRRGKSPLIGKLPPRKQEGLPILVGALLLVAARALGSGSPTRANQNIRGHAAPKVTTRKNVAGHQMNSDD